MFQTSKKPVRRRGARLGRRCGPFTLIALTGVVLTAVVGCPFPFLPSPAEFEAFNEQVESLQPLDVRIVNDTSSVVQVELVSGIPDVFSDALFATEPFLTSVDSAMLLIAPGGTVTGSIKCGEVIGVSVSAPSDQAPQGFEGAHNMFGLFISIGNVDISGVGTEGIESFTGDLAATVRFVLPDEDRIDCATDTLALRIETVATSSIFDSETGELIVSGRLGSGSLSIE